MNRIRFLYLSQGDFFLPSHNSLTVKAEATVEYLEGLPHSVFERAY